MRIDRLELHNFRVIERFVATFDPNFNVIIGENGRGKTTILEVLTRVLRCWSGRPVSLIAPADVRVVERVVDGMPYRQDFAPSRVGLMGRGPDGFPFSASEGTSASAVQALKAITPSRVGRVWEAARTNPVAPLPVLALFSPWREEPHRRKPRLQASEPQRRLDGYHDALDLHADLKGFVAWLTRFDRAANQEARSFPAVEAARAAVVTCLPDCVDLRWMFRFNDVMVQRTDGSLEPLWRLSDGYRTVAALVGELALRAAILNPGLTGVPANVEGVVLIDELDLHLHPRWQRHVVADLQRAFPKVQFFATTHSPFIIQSMRSEQVFNLDRDVTMPYQRSSVEDIAEEAMGVDDVQRSQRFHEMMEAASAFFEMLRAVERGATEPADVRRRYQELMALYADDPAYAALLRAEAAAAMGGA